MKSTYPQGYLSIGQINVAVIVHHNTHFQKSYGRLEKPHVNILKEFLRPCFLNLPELKEINIDRMVNSCLLLHF